MIHNLELYQSTSMCVRQIKFCENSGTLIGVQDVRRCVKQQLHLSNLKAYQTGDITTK